MLSERQKSQLENRFKKDYGEPVEIVVKIGAYRPPTREFGKGYPIFVYIRYLADGEKDLSTHISMCQEDYTALDKAKEIGRYLRDDLNLGEIVKVRR